MEKKKISTALMALLLIVPIVGIAFKTSPAFSAQALPREETLYVDIDGGRVGDPTNWNWLLPTGMLQQGYQQLIMEQMAYVNLETGEYIPWLSIGYEYNLDFTKFTITLRSDVTWSDGESFTADDVVFTYNTVLNNVPTVRWSSEANRTIESVTKVDDYTVEISLKKANPRFHLERLSGSARFTQGLFVLPKHIWEGKDVLTYKFDPPVGTGPYKVVSSSETTFVYERRDDWWATEAFGIRPGPKYVVYVWYGPEETRAMRAAIHELDSMADINPGTLETLMEKNPFMRAWYAELPYLWLDPCPRYLSLNWERYPTNITEVRKAISYMVDREEIVRVGQQNSTFPSWGTLPFYGAMDPYFAAIEDLIDEYDWLTTQNLTKSEEILTGLGWTKGGDDIWVTDKGTRFEMAIDVAGSWVEHREQSIVVQQQLRAGGIDVSLNIMELNPWTPLWRGEYDATIYPGCPGDTDPYFTLHQWGTQYYVPAGTSTGAHNLNVERYRNPEYDAIMDEWALTPTSNQQKCIELFREAMDIWFTDLIGGVPLVQARKIIPFDYFYWIGWPNADNPWCHPPNWWAIFARVLTGYQSPETGEWVGGIRPRETDYTTVYFTNDTRKFRGIDLTWYGPFEAGAAARLLVDDAEFWIAKNYASYTPAFPGIPELTAFAEALSALVTNIGNLTTNMESLLSSVQSISNTVTYLAVGIVVEAVVVIVLAIALLRRKPE